MRLTSSDVSLFFGKKNSILFSIKQIALQKNNKAICSTLKNVWGFFVSKKAPALGIPGREESTWKAVNCGFRLPSLICIFFESYSFFNKHKYLTIL